MFFQFGNPGIVMTKVVFSKLVCSHSINITDVYISHKPSCVSDLLLLMVLMFTEGKVTAFGTQTFAISSSPSYKQLYVNSV